MTDQDTPLKPKDLTTEEVKVVIPDKKEPVTTIDAIKTDLLQQYQNMAAITIVMNSADDIVFGIRETLNLVSVFFQL